MIDSHSASRGQSWRQTLAHHAPFSLLRHLAKPAMLCSCYHIVADSAPAHIRHLFAPRGIQEFERDLEFFARHFRAIHPQAASGLFERPALTRPGGFLVTFDDGLREAFEIAAPILKRRGIRAVFFINSAFVDNRTLFYRHKASLLIEALSAANSPSQRSRVSQYLTDGGIQAATPEAGVLAIGYDNRHHLDALAALLEVDFADYLLRQRPYMTTAQIRQLAADGHRIGAHSVDHPPFEALSAAEQLRQFEESLDFVREQFASPQPWFAFPFHAKGLAPQLLERSLSRGTTLFTTAGCGAHAATRAVDRITMERPGCAQTLVNLALLKSLLQ